MLCIRAFWTLGVARLSPATSKQIPHSDAAAIGLSMLSGRDISDTRLQIDALDGLRGLAVLLVFLSHTSSRRLFLLPGMDVAGAGKGGVFLFFVLSAFLLTQPFLVREDAARKTFLLNYAVRRFLRIYPLYLLYLSLGLVTTHFVLFWPGIRRRVTMPFSLDLQEFGQHLILAAGKEIAWSIPVEFKYYFVLPVLALVYSKLLKGRIVPCGLFTLALIFVSSWLWPASESLTNDVRLQPYLPIFLLGSFLAVVHRHWQERQPSDLQVKILSALGLLCALAIISMTPAVASWIWGEPVSRFFFHQYFFLYGLLWSVVLFAAINGKGLLPWLFELEPLRYLGFISFSV